MSLFIHFLRSWRHHPIIQTGALVVLTGTFTVVFSIYLFFSNMERILVSWGSNIEMNIFLKDGLKNNETLGIKEEIEKLNFFKKIDLITKEDAADQFFLKMSEYVPEFAAEKEFLSIIPSSLVASIASSKSLSDLQEISTRVEGVKGVEDVSYGQEWVENFSAFITAIQNIGWAISTILILGALFVISFTVYTVIVRRKDEIEIYELCGATKNMIQMPYIFEGAFISLIAAVLGIVISYFVLTIQNQFFVSEMIYIGLNSVFKFFGIIEVFALVAIATFIGAAISYFCIQKLNTGWSQASNWSTGEP